MILQTEKLRLRAVEEKDADVLLNMINDPSVEHMTVGSNPPISRKMQLDWILNYHNSDKEMRFIVETENKYAIGMVTLSEIDWKNRICNLGYKRDALAEGRFHGDMQLAVKMVLDYAFAELNMHRVEEHILDYNDSSLRLAHEIGMREEGVLRQRIYKGGAFHDVINLAMLEDEWRQLKRKASE